MCTFIPHFFVFIQSLWDKKRAHHITTGTYHTVVKRKKVRKKKRRATQINTGAERVEVSAWVGI
jgi:uncharacterized membrane protein